MKIIVRDAAADDIEAIHAYIAQINPAAALAVVDRLTDRIVHLADSGFGNLGRPGSEPGTRELIEPPYGIVYRYDQVRDELVVLSVIHGARRR
jgi:plasmid stabilization system protein ParE